MTFYDMSQVKDTKKGPFVVLAKYITLEKDLLYMLCHAKRILFHIQQICHWLCPYIYS